MTKSSNLFRRLALAITLMVALTGSISAHAGVVVTSVGSALTEADGVATAKFKIQVENGDAADIANVRVSIGDIEIAVGDVAAGATAVSSAQKFLFDAATLLPTKHVPVPVTIKYVVDGVETSVAGSLILNRAE